MTEPGTPAAPTDAEPTGLAAAAPAGPPAATASDPPAAVPLGPPAAVSFGPPAAVSIGILRDAEVARCAELEALLFPGDDPWTARAFRQELRAGYDYRAARIGDRLVGYAGLAFVAPPPDPEAEVHTIGVDPAHQGRGIGRALLRARREAADAAGAVVFLEVRTDNAAAQALYASEGFTVIGLRRRYYRPSGADAHTMRRQARP